MITLKMLTEKYLNYCAIQKELNFKTIKAYKIDLNQFISILPSKYLPISKDCLLAYITQIHNSYQPKTIKRKIASVKAFFRYLEYEEFIESNPFNKIDISFRQPIRLPTK